MTIEARLSDGRILQFPDGTSPQVIQTTVKRMIGDQNGDDISSDVADSGDSSIGQRVLGGLEAAGTIVSSAVTEPVAGLAGLAAGIGAGVVPGGRDFAEAGAETVEAAREALTFQPRTEAGQESLKAVGGVLAPVGEAFESVESGLGNAVFESTGSPAAAAVATAVPTAILEAVGLGVGGRVAKGSKRIKPTKRVVDRAIKQSSPDASTLKDASRAIYQDLDQSGIRLKGNSYNRLFRKIEGEAKKQGLDARVTPKAAGALDVMKDTLGKNPTLTEVDTLRKVAQNVAGNIDRTEAALGNLMIRQIDDFLDTVSPQSLTKGSVSASEVGAKYRTARNLWGRARKSELLQEAIEKAKDRASGFENGIRVELGKIANNSKKAKFFSRAEQAAMRDIVRGSSAQNFAKLVGRFGFSEGRATNVLAALGGVGAGGIAGGGFGAFAVPAVGTASRKVAQSLTKNRAAFLDSMVKAGADGRKIAQAYISTVPKGKRSVAGLSELLLDPSITNIDSMMKASNKLVREAAEVAEGRRIIGQAMGAVAPAVQVEEQQ